MYSGKLEYYYHSTTLLYCRQRNGNDLDAVLFYPIVNVSNRDTLKCFQLVTTIFKICLFIAFFLRYAAYEFSAGEHGGTHLDAPYHFSNTGKRVGDFPIDKLILPRK